MQAAGLKCGGIHGDIDQYSRMEALKKFKGGAVHVLVATDVAARGLDVRSVKAVVNFDVAASLDTHVHRVGRTGRAGDRDGTAYTLVMPHESRMAAAIAGSMQQAGQDVSKCAPASRPACAAVESRNHARYATQHRRPHPVGNRQHVCVNTSVCQVNCPVVRSDHARSTASIQRLNSNRLKRVCRDCGSSHVFYRALLSCVVYAVMLS